MAIKKCGQICQHCQAHFLIDSSCGGDYHEKVGLQRWCPDCGQMLPIIEVAFEMPFISKRKKRTVAIRTANRFNLNFDDCKNIALSEIKTRDYDKFQKEFILNIKNFFGIKLNLKDVNRIFNDI